MKRMLVVIALLAPLALAAQQAPVIQPKVTNLGIVIDSAGDGSLMPQTASMSPNGRLLAYTTSRDLRIWNVAAKSGTVLVPVNSFDPVWSRSGDAIVFNRREEQGNRSFVWLQRLDASSGKAVGGPQRVGLSPTTGRSAQLSPDGKTIAFPRQDSPRRSSLVLVPSNGGSERVLASGYDVRQIRWSLDGSSISYASQPDSSRSGRYRVWRVAVSGGTPELLYDAGIPEDAPRIMDDGRLLFPGPSLLDWSERTIKDAAGKTQGVLRLPIDTWEDGTGGEYKSVAVREVRPRALRLVEIATGTRRTLIDTTAESSSMVWFADGRRLAALVRRNGTFALSIFGVDGREQKSIALSAAPRFTATLDGRWHSDLTLSPDGRYATYIGYGRGTLELVDVTNGQQRTLARSNITVTNPVWRADSRTIRYILDGAVSASNTTRSVHDVTVDGADKLVRRLPFSELPGPATVLASENYISAFGPPAPNHIVLPLDGSAPRVMLTTPAFGGLMSPDGRTMMVKLGSLLSNDPSRRVAFESLTDGTVRQLDLPFADVRYNGGQFHPDGKSVFIAGRNSPSDPVIIYSVPVDGSAPREVVRANTNEPGSMFAVSPDGKYIAFVEAGAQRAALLGVDFTDGVGRLAASGRRE